MKILNLFLIAILISSFSACNVEEELEELLNGELYEELETICELSEEDLTEDQGYICFNSVLLDFSGLKYYEDRNDFEAWNGHYGWGPENGLDQLELGQVNWEKGVWWFNEDEDDPAGLSFWTPKTEELYPNASSILIMDNPEVIVDDSDPNILIYKGDTHYYRGVDTEDKTSIGIVIVKMMKN